MSNVQQGMSNVQQGMSNVQQGAIPIPMYIGIGIGTRTSKALTPSLALRAGSDNALTVMSSLEARAVAGPVASSPSLSRIRPYVVLAGEALGLRSRRGYPITPLAT